MVKNEMSDAIRKYREVVSLHEKTLKYFRRIDLNPELLQIYMAQLHHLRTRTDEQVLVILGFKSKPRAPKRTVTEVDLSDDVIERLNLDQVLDQINAKSTSRGLLERIAVVRFGVTKGAMSSLSSRDALVDKIMTLVRNEGTHSSIARAVDSRRRTS